MNILICFQIILKYKCLGDQWAQMDFAFIDQTDGIHIVIVAVHHGALDVQLMVVCHSQIYSSHVCENSYQDDDAAFAGVFDGLSW